MKYKQIKTNLTPDEYEKIKQIAQENNLTLSSYVRKILNMENELKDLTNEVCCHNLLVSTCALRPI